MYSWAIDSERFGGPESEPKVGFGSRSKFLRINCPKTKTHNLPLKFVKIWIRIHTKSGIWIQISPGFNGKFWINLKNRIQP